MHLTELSSKDRKYFINLIESVLVTLNSRPSVESSCPYVAFVWNLLSLCYFRDLLGCVTSRSTLIDWVRLVRKALGLLGNAV